MKKQIDMTKNVFFFFFFDKIARDKKFRGRLVHMFKHMFSVFKQQYTYFYTLFHPHIFPKKLKTIV